MLKFATVVDEIYPDDGNMFMIFGMVNTRTRVA